MSNQAPSGYNQTTQQGAAVQRGPGNQSQALARPRATATELAGSFTDPNVIRERLEKAAQLYNLIGPATTATPPVGCEVAINSLLLTADDVFPIAGGKFGLLKTAIDKIALAAGVKVVESRCLSYTPRMCSYTVTVEVRRFDGTPVQSTATKLMDLRPGSPYLASLTEANAKQQLAMLPAHAETKARLRATRALLSIRSYTKEELAKPFVTASIMFTGRTEDPELKRLFATGMMMQFLGATASMYGNVGPSPFAAPQMGTSAPAVAMLGSGQSTPQQAMAPQLGGYSGQGNGGELPADIGNDDYDGETGEVGGTMPAPKAGDPSKIFMPGKKGEAKLIKDASDKDLDYWGGRLAKSMEEGTSQSPERDGEKLATIRAQQVTRAGGSAATSGTAHISVTGTIINAQGASGPIDDGYGDRDLKDM